jgi:hypothetical protein
MFSFLGALGGRGGFKIFLFYAGDWETAGDSIIGT